MANVLVVDDSQVMRNNLKNFLEREGHNVIAEAEQGYNGYLKYKQYKPDFVTMDITMPVMDGIEAVGKIISEFPDAKIIMVSALGQKKMVLEALRKGAKYFIVKPITEDRIKEAVDKVLKGKLGNKIKKEVEEKVKEKPKEKKEEVIEDDIDPFKVNKEEEKFIVEINRTLDKNNFVRLESALKVCQYIENLYIVFKFNEVEKLEKELVSKLEDVMKVINNTDSKMDILSDNDTFVEYIKENNSGIFAELITFNPPFEIKNKDEQIIITLNQTFVDDFNKLRSALNACLYVKPLHLIFNLNQLELEINNLASNLEGVIMKVDQLGGKIEFLSVEGDRIDLIEKVGGMPFKIINKSDKFIVEINENYSDDKSSYFLEALNVFSYLTPLQTVFKFSGVKSLEDDLITCLKDTMEFISEAGGEIEVFADNPNFSDAIKEGNNGIFSKLMDFKV